MGNASGIRCEEYYRLSGDDSTSASRKSQGYQPPHFNGNISSTQKSSAISDVEIRMRVMAKKTGMSDSSLWIVTIVLLALTAWMFFKK